MAGGGEKWPGPVTFNDEDPKGYASVFLTIPGLKVKGILKKEPVHGKVTPQLTPGRVCITAVVDGNTFKYDKQLPVDINPKESNVKYKDGQVIVYLKKVVKDSWREHRAFLLSP